jgi:hypothetical protein
MSASIVPIAVSVAMAAAPLALLTELVAGVPEGEPHNAQTL